MSSHSLEEVEALCPRIGILVDGRLLCLGNVPYIKQRYGSTITLELFFHAGSSDDIFDSFQKALFVFVTDKSKQVFMQEVPASVTNAKKPSEITHTRSLTVENNVMELENSVFEPDPSDDTEKFKNRIEGMPWLATADEAAVTLPGPTIEIRDNVQETSIHLQATAQMAGGMERSVSQLLNQLSVNTEDLEQRKFEIHHENPLTAKKAEPVTLVERCDYRFVFFLDKSLVKQSSVFRWMEQNREEFKINSYAVGNTGLEDIFNEFATLQNSLSDKKH
jgi:hypothetical protein